MSRYIIAIVTSWVIVLSSCEPRIDMDLAQWGDQAYIQDVQIFQYEFKDDLAMAEFYETGEYTTGVRRVILSKTSVDIEKENFVVTITVPSLKELTEAGFLITHRSTLVEPLNGSPKAGLPADLTYGSFTYRLHSADGTKHDWTINIIDK